jgi:fumarylpyruvate hydrolase
MTALLFPAPDQPTLTVRGVEAALPVRRVFCVGRNYAAHAAEMGVEVDREAPFYFTKSALTVVPTGCTIPYPPGTRNYHYEMELVVVLGAPAYRVAKEDAMAAVYGYACGLDMTRRDLQLAAREKGRPWDLGKDFEQSAIVAPVTRVADFGPVMEQRITLEVDGVVKQDARLADLVWSVPELIADLSTHYHLEAGDIIFTGTPAGVGPVGPGARIRGDIEGLDPVELAIGEPA